MILNKYLFCILLFFIGSAQAQTNDKEKPSHEKFQREYKYVKQKNYSGPESNYSDPQGMEEAEDNGDYYEGLEYSPESIKRSRESRKMNADPGQGGSTGDQEYDPRISEPEPVEFDPPDIDTPDVDIPDVNAPSISPNFWRALLFIGLFILLAWLAYVLIKKYNPKVAVTPASYSASDWNPEMIPKTELELRLEAAMAREDYRECVRIYFTFIMKELIRLRRIQWKRELTNYDYILQMMNKDGFSDFNRSVNIYDLVWYGDYEITSKEYQAVLPHLENNYKSLTAEHE